MVFVFHCLAYFTQCNVLQFHHAVDKFHMVPLMCGIFFLKSNSCTIVFFMHLNLKKNPHIRSNMWNLSFPVWLISLSIMLSRFTYSLYIHLSMNTQIVSIPWLFVNNAAIKKRVKMIEGFLFQIQYITMILILQ